MGSVISTVYHRLLLTIVGGLRLVFSPLDKVARRIGQSPGLPLPDPSQSYWMMPPSPISCHNAGPSVRVPEYSDIVIIGSGITGTSFARTILDWANEHRENPPHVVMLEAREACSGATGRCVNRASPLPYMLKSMPLMQEWRSYHADFVPGVRKSQETTRNENGEENHSFSLVASP